MEIDLEALFDRYRRHGDAAALEQVLDGAAPELLRLAMHLAPGAAAAEDLVQATFLRAIEHAGRFDAGRSLMAWLIGILMHEGARARRERARGIDPERLEERESVDPLDEAAGAELTGVVRDAVCGLPEPYATVLRAHLLDGARAVDIASRIGRAPGTVRMQILRGLELLRKALPPSLATAAFLATGTRGHAAMKAAVLARAAELAALPPVRPVSSPATPAARFPSFRFPIGETMLPTLALSLGAVGLVVLATPRDPRPAITPPPARALPVAAIPAAPQLRLHRMQTVASVSVHSRPGAASSEAIEGPVIAGHVRDTQGQPVAGAVVELRRPELRTFETLDRDGTQRSELVATAISDAEGAFSFAVAAATPHDLSVQQGVLSALSGSRHAGETVDLVLEPERIVRGHVLHADGRPAAGATLRVRTRTQPYEAFETTAQADGGFELSVPARPRCSLQALHPDGSNFTFDLVFDGDGVCKQDVRLQRPTTLVGRVTDAVSGATLSGVTIGEGWTLARTVTTDENGDYVFPGCTWSDLVVRAEGYATGRPDALPVPEGAGARLDFALSPGGSVAGRVVDEYGDPVDDAYVEVVSMVGSQADRHATRSDASGGYVLANLQAVSDPGEGYALRVGKAGLATQVSDLPLDLGVGAPLALGDVILRPAQIVSGRAVDAGGAPVPGAALTLEGWNGDRFNWVGGDGSAPNGAHYVSRRTTISDAEGRFWFGDLPAGTFELTGLCRGRTESDGQVFVLADGALRDDLVVTFGGTRSVFGHVVDAGGAPVAGASVSVWREGLSDGSVPTARTDSDGAFAIDGLPEGAFQLSASGTWLDKDSDHPWLPVTQEGAEDGPHELVLVRGTTITGRLLDATGEPAIGCYVQPRVESLTEPIQGDTSGLDGHFRVVVPENSTWTIDVWSAEGDPVLSVDAVEAGSSDLAWSLPD
jgi:RNA polymerase sigma-70 factor (ECF subfamily)